VNFEWPKEGTPSELAYMSPMARITIRTKPVVGEHKMWVNRWALEYMGDPDSIEGTIDPVLKRVKVTARGQYPLQTEAKQFGGRYAVFRDGRFMPKGVYAPVAGLDNTYEYVGTTKQSKIARGVLQKTKQRGGAK
jgi:hypothetical protein